MKWNLAKIRQLLVVASLIAVVGMISAEAMAADYLGPTAAVASKDGKEHSRARWSHVVFEPADEATKKATRSFVVPIASPKATAAAPDPKIPTAPLVQPRKPDGKGSVKISGELKQWHAVTVFPGL